MGKVISTFRLTEKYDIKAHTPELFVVCDKENNPVTFSPKGYGTWRKHKMMYWSRGHAQKQADDLNSIFKAENFKVVKFIPSKETNN